jgi:hypothetical protein
MDEHRAAQRHRVFKAGSIQFGGSTIDCTVRNLANTGAMLEVVSQAAIPHEFTLLSLPIGPIGAAMSYGARTNE